MTPKSEQGSLAAPKNATALPSRQSFFDTLAGVSSAPVQRPGATHSEARHGSDESSNDSARNQDQSSNSFSIHSKKILEAPNKAQQSEKVSQSTQPTDSKTNQSEEKAVPEKSSWSASVRKSDGSFSKKATFTVQMASPFILQASTEQPELNGMLPVLATATGTDGLASKAGSQEQSIEAQYGNAISDQGSELQGQPGVAAAILFSDAQDVLSKQALDAEQASKASQLAGSTDGEVEAPSTLLDKVSQSKGQATDSALQSDADVANAASNASVFDPTRMMQSSLTAEPPEETAVRPGNGNPNQAIAKSIQSKVSGSAFGLNSDAGDTSKTTKSDGAQNDRSSAHAGGVASAQAPTPQSDGAHVTSVEVKGSDAGALQSVVLAAQAEVRGTTGAHSAAGLIETTANRGSESEAPKSEQLTGSELAGMSGISTARLIQTMSASEMRVGMHSSEFGDISIRTSISQQQMQTQISVDHNELGTALSAHIPNMQAKLGSEYGLHATIEVNQSGASFSSDGDRSQQHQQKATFRPFEAVEGPAVMQNETLSMRGSTTTSSNSRLDIRA